MKEKKTTYSESAPYVLTFQELREVVPDVKVSTSLKNTRVAFVDVDERLGMFRRSDFIIIYGDDGKPIVVTERVYRRNYSIFDWWKLKRQLKEKSKHIRQEYGYDITIDIQGRYFDYTHYRGDEFADT